MRTHHAASLLPLLAVCALAAALYAGDAAPPEPLPAPTVVVVDGAPAAVVPAPAEASPAEVAAVAHQSAENLRAVADGEVTIEQATRDPRETLDPGADYIFWIVGIVAAAVLRGVNDLVVSRAPRIPDSAASLLGLLIVVGVYIGAWAALSDYYPELPQTWPSWAFAGVIGSGLVSGAKSGRAWRGEVVQARTGQYPQQTGQRP